MFSPCNKPQCFHGNRVKIWNRRKWEMVWQSSFNSISQYNIELYHAVIVVIFWGIYWTVCQLLPIIFCKKNKK